MELIGRYYAAISFTTIFAIFVDLGFTTALIREIAKDQDKATRWLGNTIALKIPLALLTLIVTIAIAYVSGYDHFTFELILISSISMILDSFTATFFAVARGFHNLKYESISSVVFQLIVLGVGYLAIHFGFGVRTAIAILALASVYNFIYSFIITRYKFHLNWRPVWDKKFAWTVFIISWPFAVYALFQRFYTYFDSVLLTYLAGYAQVGLYQIAFKITNALQFLPMAFTASLYPAMSAYWLGNREQLVVSFERAMNYLIIVSLPIIAGVLALDDKIVAIFKVGSEGIWPLRLSIIALFFIFINFPIGSLLNACDRQKTNTRFMIIVTVSSIILNLLLIPHWQAVGASLTVLITNFLMFVLGIIEARKIIVYRPRKNLIVLLKVLSAAALMALIVYFGKGYMPILAATVLGATLYFLFLFAVGGFTIHDIKSVRTSFKHS
jgi:O-antigen/teichoic acid export membrane protein